MTILPYSWTSTSRSDVGKVRSVNEDACLARPEAGLWAVADGMGGHDAGDMASRLVVEALERIPAHSELSSIVDAIEDYLGEVNAGLRTLARDRSVSIIGSTVAALALRGEHGLCLWAGDSRVYRYREGEIEQVTQDHALVEELVERGMLDRADAAHHPHGNMVTRAVGAADELFLDMEILHLRAGDVFVLCSDGLDKEVTPEEIAHRIRDSDGALAPELVELALERGSRDNVTVVTVQVDAAGGPRDEDDEGDDTVPGLADRPPERRREPGGPADSIG